MLDIPTTIQSPPHSAVATGPDGVRFVAFGATESEVTLRLARYVRWRCEFTLWPDDANEVKRLLAAGRDDDAIEIYFARVGERWDPEFLERL